MHVAIISSIVSVLGSGFLGLLFFQFKSQRDLTTQGFATQSEQTERLFAAQNEQIGRLFTVVMSHGEELKAHGERLARIETKLEFILPDSPNDIDPPGSAEAA